MIRTALFRSCRLCRMLRALAVVMLAAGAYAWMHGKNDAADAAVSGESGALPENTPGGYNPPGD